MRRIINLLFRIKTLRSVCLKIFVTSRPEAHIRFGFKNVNETYDGIALHEIQEDVVEKDIRAYLTHEFAKIRDHYNSMALDDCQLPPDWPGLPNLDTLVKMAVPLFIFAATVCRFLRQSNTASPNTQLEKFLQFRAMSQLDATYLPVLNQLLTGVDSFVKADVICQFQELVGPVVLLETPLSPRSLETLLQIPRSIIYDRLQLLHSVIDVSDVNTPLKTFHLSFRDFLVAPYERNTNPFWVDEKETHAKLAAHCLCLMAKHLRFDMCGLDGLDGPGTRLSAIDPARIAEALPPELQYACLYWVHHAEQAGRRIRDDGEAHRFLVDHFLHWLEALSLSGRALESTGLVNALHACLEVGCFSL